MIECMAHTLTLDTVVSRRSDLLSSDLSATELVMMNLDRGFYYGMEETAKAIWERLAKPCSVANLCDDLVARYDIDRASCERDVLAFLDELLKEDLIHVHDPEAAA
jgi:hypothetical protein